MIRAFIIFFLSGVLVFFPQKKGGCTVFPIQFSLSATKWIAEIPPKVRDFAHLIPGQLDTYVYETEEEYYKGYQDAYFAVTCKRGGWDCLRHYEILANGCIPYFVDLDQCDEKTLSFLPKDLIREAMYLEGVSYLKIDHSLFNVTQYEEILTKLIAYTKEYLTSSKIAEYVLQTVGYSGVGKILFLSGDVSPDYLRCCTLIGLKESLGEKIIDVPKIEHIYKNHPSSHLYGKGFSYTQIVDDPLLDRSNVEQRILNKEFELVIYGSVHRGLPFNDLVCQTYEPEKIIYLCGEDEHQCEWPLYLQSSPLFIRELRSCK